MNPVPNVFTNFHFPGRSRESYGFQGHNITLPISNDWSNYYSTLRIMVDAAVIRRGNCDLRALIFSWNSVNIFSKKILTLNALFEFLPSGVASAKIEVRLINSRFKFTYKLTATIQNLHFDNSSDRKLKKKTKQSVVFALLFHKLCTWSINSDSHFN